MDHLQVVNPDESLIYRYLYQFCRGRAKAIKADALAASFNTSRREINDEINRLRKSGALIGSSRCEPAGYFIPNCREEAREFMSGYKSELYDMLETYNRMKRAQRNYLDSKKQPSWSTQFDQSTGQMELVCTQR